MKYFTVSTAKPKLGRLLDSVLKSGTVNEDPADYGRPRRLHFKINLFESKEGWAVSCPDLAGCHSQGSSRAEAVTNIKDAIRLWLEVEAQETGLRRVEQEDILV